MADNVLQDTFRPQQATQYNSRATHNAVYLQMQVEHRLALSTPTSLTGSDFTIAQLLAIACYSAPFEVDEKRQAIVEDSHTALSAQISSRPVYGVNTSFGANASSVVEAEDVEKVHLALQGLLAGILPRQHESQRGSDDVCPSTSLHTHTLPSPWVRGAMLLRINNFLRGHSSVRWSLIKAITQALHGHVTPVVPLQGSISASGDLSPLSYIAFALAAHPALEVMVEKGSQIEKLPAPVGLKRANLEPFTYIPKEALSFINGTSVATAVAAYALAAAHKSLLLTQVLTAVHTEAMLGFKAPFEPFLHDVARPHIGQCQVANNIRTWLKDSSMLQDRLQGKAGRYMGPTSIIVAAVSGVEVDCQRESAHFLKQDRYAIRTAPQWLGPVVEDFLSAHRTLSLELNSSTDNPLFDPSADSMLHGGNFQASSVTNAVEKVRDGLSTIGRLLFAQQCELLNASRSNGLPACLAPCAGPSLDGGLKGLDIHNAAYISELNYLANRANHFVQSAEMDNQCVNSLALISARYTAMAGEVAQKLLANSIYGALQAIDLRVAFSKWIAHIISDESGILDLPGVQKAQKLESKAFLAHLITFEFMRNSHLDLRQRAEYAARSVCYSHMSEHRQVAVVSSFPASSSIASSLESILATRLINSYKLVFSTYLAEPKRPHSVDLPLPSSYATASLWTFVRETLRIGPYTGLEDFTSIPTTKHADVDGDVNAQAKGKTIGSQVSEIYDALQDGRFDRFLEELLRQFPH